MSECGLDVVFQSSFTLKLCYLSGNSPTSLGEIPYTTARDMPLCDIWHRDHVSGGDVAKYVERVNI